MPDIIIVLTLIICFTVFMVGYIQDRNIMLDGILALIISFFSHWLCAYISTPPDYISVEVYKVYTVPDHNIRYIIHESKIIDISKFSAADDYVIIKKPKRFYYGVFSILIRDNKNVTPDIIIDNKRIQSPFAEN